MPGLPAPERIRVAVPARLAYRDAVGALVRSVCADLEDRGVARPGTADEVLSAFNEAFNNLALHGYRDSKLPDGCEIEVELQPGRMVLRLMDRGKGFDPEKIRAPELADGSEMAEGGYGFFIMRSFMSEVAYQRGGAGEVNVLTMVRNLGGSSGSGGERC